MQQERRHLDGRPNRAAMAAWAPADAVLADRDSVSLGTVSTDLDTDPAGAVASLKTKKAQGKTS